MEKSIVSYSHFNGFHIEFYNGATEDDISQFVDLDCIVYPEDYNISYEMIQNWNKKNSKIYCVAKENKFR
jgi:nitrogen regulatory protein PII-like uncharacterized protein